jgi:hypothetical protein
MSRDTKQPEFPGTSTPRRPLRPPHCPPAPILRALSSPLRSPALPRRLTSAARTFGAVMTSWLVVVLRVRVDRQAMLPRYCWILRFAA